MTVYELTNATYKVNTVIIHLWKHDSMGHEVCHRITKQNTKEDKYAVSDTYEYRNCDVMFFSSPKRSTIEIWATDETYRD